MKKIIYLPLDERPCNYEFPYRIFDRSQFKIIRPPKTIMGNKKTPAPYHLIRKWLQDYAGISDGAVIAVDTLLYGGIIPSRMHNLDVSELKERMALIQTIKKEYPQLVIYAYQLIMRTPQYNSADEEPDYYQDWGRDIFCWGYLRHLSENKTLTEKQQEELKKINIPEQYLQDYLKRREINLSLNMAILDYVAAGTIDFLVIPQDDASPYGWTALDQNAVRMHIRKKNLLSRVYLYPGADEAGGVLMARMLCRLQSFTPKIYIKYPSPAALTLIPSLEDRYLDTMVKYQIMAAGGIIVNSLKEADTVYIVNAAADRMLSSFSGEAPGRGIEVLRNGVEAIEFARYAASLSKAVIVGDITYGNGSPPDIYHLLNNGGLLFSVAGFAGWNTAANSVGSALAQGISYLVNGPSLNHYDFLVSRYIEDIGYCGNVRQKVMAEVLPLYPQYNYFDVKEEEGEMAGIIKRLLNDFLQKEMPEIFHHGKIVRLRMPWRRLYEIDLAAKYLK